MAVVYTLRRMDEDLWKAAQTRAKAEGRSMKGVLMLLLQLYVKVGLGALEHAAEPPPAPRLRRAAAEVQP